MNSSFNDEISFGVIPLRQQGTKWQLFLVQHCAGHWAFPKGHPEANETPQETASRELFEETGLTVKEYFPTPPLKEIYFFTRHKKRVKKQVIYFLAEVEGTVVLQSEEILEGGWFSLEQAKEQLTFSEAKSLCDEILNSI